MLSMKLRKMELNLICKLMHMKKTLRDRLLLLFYFCRNTYQLLLGTYCKAGEIEKAIGVLDLMDKENLHINEKSYNNLVQCNVICG